jgi:hypothetical protein
VSQETQVVGDCHNGDPASVSSVQSTNHGVEVVLVGRRELPAHGNLAMGTYSIWSNYAPIEMARASNGRNHQ